MLQKKQPRKKELKKKLKPKWEKMKEDETGFPESFWKGEKKVGVWRYLGIPISYLLFLTSNNSSWGEVLHLTIKKLDQLKAHMDVRYYFDSEEPTFAEKIQARQVIRQTNRIGLEVFPKESNLIDGANLYHVWLLPEEFEFPFSIVLPEEIPLTESTSGISYGKKEVSTQWGSVTYYLLEDSAKKELKWKQKQTFKNDVCGKESLAIEIIPAKASCSPYQNKSCLICLPEQMNLPFGLR